MTPPDGAEGRSVDGRAQRVKKLTTVTPTVHRAPAQPHRSAKAVKGDAPAQQANSYKVKKGDTLYHIAKAEYGDGKKWTVIASANPGISPQSLKAGQMLRIPP